MRNFPTRTWLKAVAIAPVLALLGLLAPGAPLAGATDSSALLDWSQLTPAVAPPARHHAGLAFDAATGTTVLFGGRSGSQVLGDTWTWDGSAWTLQHPIASPPPMESASLAYDSLGHRLVLFGGLGSDGNASGATWSWDGTTWAALATASTPPARYAASVAADAVTGTDVLFGGLSAPGSSLSDTWSWDGTNWVANTPAQYPPARSGAAMAFDAIRGLVVLFGGTTGSDTRADTWTWDGTNWSQQTPVSSPPARTDAAFGFDPATQSAVLFGGSAAGGALADTWLWNGSTWSTSRPLSLVPTLSPPARIGASIATAPANQRLVMFGGQSGDSNTSLNDTWRVTTLVTGPSPPPSSTTVVPAGGSTTTVAGATTTSSTTPVTSRSSTTTVPVSTPTTVAAPARAPLAVTSRSVHRGDQVTVSGSGFVPGSRITITFHSVTVVVGTTIADSGGRFTAIVLVPTDAPTGPHHIEADGPANAGGRAVLVAQVSITAPGSRHSWLLPAFMVALTVLLAAGAGLVLTASTRWHRLSLMR